MDENKNEYYTINFLGIEFNLWSLVLSINVLLFIITYISYRFIFFHGYQVSLEKTLNILQSKSTNTLLIKNKNKQK